jgi:hypothetical protein
MLVDTLVEALFSEPHSRCARCLGGRGLQFSGTTLVFLCRSLQIDSLMTMAAAVYVIVANKRDFGPHPPTPPPPLQGAPKWLLGQSYSVSSQILSTCAPFMGCHMTTAGFHCGIVCARATRGRSGPRAHPASSSSGSSIPTYARQYSFTSPAHNNITMTQALIARHFTSLGILYRRARRSCGTAVTKVVGGG